MLHLEFNSESENEGIARIVTSAYIMRFDPDMEEMEDVKTAVSEAVTNCIVHAYFDENGKIEMDISDKEQIVKIEITDHGIGIPDVKKAMEPMYNQKKRGQEWDFLLWRLLWMKCMYIQKKGKGPK